MRFLERSGDLAFDALADGCLGNGAYREHLALNLVLTASFEVLRVVELWDIGS